MRISDWSSDVCSSDLLRQAGKAVARGLQLTADRLADNVGEFLSEESGLMANRPSFEDWAGTLQSMRQRLDRLEARVTALGASPTRASLGKGGFMFTFFRLLHIVCVALRYRQIGRAHV